MNPENTYESNNDLPSTKKQKSNTNNNIEFIGSSTKLLIDNLLNENKELSNCNMVLEHEVYKWKRLYEEAITELEQLRKQNCNEILIA